MKSNQKFSPKYWVVHDVSTDDVFIDTASKSLAEAEHKYITKYLRPDRSLDYYDNDNLKCILIKIKEV
jgi:hypothetical protein